MWPLAHTEITTAAPATVWALWEAVDRWPEWDEGIDRVTLDGPLAAGSTGRITPSGSPSWAFGVIAAQAGRSFTDETRLPLCRLRFAHELAPTDDGRTAITIRVSFHGLLRPLFQRVIGSDIAADLAAQTARLARAAEAQEHLASATLVG
ncbi:MAG: SRPBCC family protein [Patulibacter minatonensis]